VLLECLHHLAIPKVDISTSFVDESILCCGMRGGWLERGDYALVHIAANSSWRRGIKTKKIEASDSRRSLKKK